MFIQVGCVLASDELQDRRVTGLAYACMVVFMSLAIINYFDYIKKIQENKYIEWDLKTITSSDYTVEFAIDIDMFDEWDKTMLNDWRLSQREVFGIEYVSRVEAFRDWLQCEIEERLDEMYDVCPEDEPIEFIKVAMTTFAFNNDLIINLLKERGDIIKNEKWEQMK